MCLNLNPKFKKMVAKKDITCYKIVKKKNYGGCYMYEALIMMFFIYKLNIIYSTMITMTHTPYTNRLVVNNGFHSFRTIQGLKKEAEYILMYHNSGILTDAVIVKCIIPKGSLYYVGHNDNYTPNYVSNQIVILNEIPNNK